MSASPVATSNYRDQQSPNSLLSFLSRIRRTDTAREIAILIGFCLLTVLMTWPWVLHLRDAVADKGDPYMIAWTLWWDFHQTFHHPLHLFDANVFYPYRYTLAFSENDYGIAILFFPLFALGLRPLTVHAIATFFGFAFSGYGAFRLTRTLTADNKAAWFAGIIFAFIPYRFHVLSHLHYLFAGWIPLLCEALILFWRQPTWKRAGWMGAAFLMNALSCVSWFIMTMIPLALTLTLLLFTGREGGRDRKFWIRGAVALGIALILFSPFLFAYYRVSVLYGLRWQPWEFAANSALPIHWLKCDPRNKLWHNLGASIPGGQMLFPGLLAPLLAVAALWLRAHDHLKSAPRLVRRLINALDVAVILSIVVLVVVYLHGDLDVRLRGLRIIKLDEHSLLHAWTIIIGALFFRFMMMLPSLRPRWRPHSGSDAERSVDHPYAIGLIWMAYGYFASLGANFFLNRWLHDYVLLFQSIRIPARAAMICYVGLAVLGGIGAAQVAENVRRHVSLRHARPVILTLIGLTVLFELRAAPLYVEKGEVEPSAVARRLAITPMTGGLVELPSDPGTHRHLYMLRAADHERPLVNATSSFISPLTDKINQTTKEKIDRQFIDLLEQIPASYLVVHNDRLAVEERTNYENFLARQTVGGRLRFVNRFDGHDDLYAVVKNEPAAKSEGPLPFETSFRDWGTEMRKDPLNLLARPAESKMLYRVLLLTSGDMPHYADFLPAIETLGTGVILGSDEEAEQFEYNLKQFLPQLARRYSLNELDNRSYLDRLIHNSNVGFDDQSRHDLTESLDHGKSRTDVLLRVANDPRFLANEADRSLLLLHYFAYLRRNPGDPPDRDLRGFNFWLHDLSQAHDVAKLAVAFENSIEYHSIKERPQ